jgi:hypothetical protein
MPNDDSTLLLGEDPAISPRHTLRAPAPVKLLQETQSYRIERSSTRMIILWLK